MTSEVPSYNKIPQLKRILAPSFLKAEDCFLQWQFTFQKAAGSVEFPYTCGSAPEHSSHPEEG